MPLLKNKSWPHERTLYWEHERSRAIRMGNWKLSALENQDWELFDLSKDRTEMHDLSKEYPEKVELMNKKWGEWAIRVGLIEKKKTISEKSYY